MKMNMVPSAIFENENATIAQIWMSLYTQQLMRLTELQEEEPLQTQTTTQHKEHP